MGLFGDFFSDPWFDINGDGKVDMFEEMVAFDMLFGDTDNEGKNSFASPFGNDPFGFDDSGDYDDPYGFDGDDSDDPFGSDDFGDYPFDY